MGRFTAGYLFWVILRNVTAICKLGSREVVFLERAVFDVLVVHGYKEGVLRKEKWPGNLSM